MVINIILWILAGLLGLWLLVSIIGFVTSLILLIVSAIRFKKNKNL